VSERHAVVRRVDRRSNDALQQCGRKHVDGALSFEDHLEQHALGEIFASLCVDDLDVFAISNEGRELLQVDVALGLGVVEAPVSVFLDRPHATGLTGGSLSRCSKEMLLRSKVPLAALQHGG
jgi:hypothetical protein